VHILYAPYRYAVCVFSIYARHVRFRSDMSTSFYMGILIMSYVYTLNTRNICDLNRYLYIFLCRYIDMSNVLYIRQTSAIWPCRFVLSVSSIVYICG